jgi:hypothetical protein
MYDKYVTEYAEGIAKRKYKLSEGLFHSEYLMRQYQSEIWDYLEKIGVIYNTSDETNFDKWRVADIEWDYYDNSLELIDCEDGFTLTSEQYKKIHEELGFSIIFVNYKNGPHLYGNHTASMDAMPVIKD